MTPTLIPRTAVVIGALALVALLLGYSYATGQSHGKATVQAQWQADIQAREAAQRQAQHRQEQHYADHIQQALAARDAHIQHIQARADSARAAAERLRKQLAASRHRIAQATPTTATDYAHTATELLADCTARYTDVARAADGHAADAAALIQAWPQNIHKQMD